ncbi:helix-turn-helix domain-containing protein [Lapillicoccus jejuensis]|uniref:DNA-binding PucR family transcriptional regulator n=1 Tax=Lapillicoccus jejuensis TaxID=402171 RepID=A0A542E029_9MICO|nr:helix-turn-helix domain-containing protein [Lapillicoccus jejuensis]TQJ08534.1 DNA-binding PucR family transcriptional regulator [Lapillicoccus jejuensis]
MRLEALAAALGPGLVRVVVPQPDGPEVGDVTVVEPGEGWFGKPGDLVLGVGLPDDAAAVDLLAGLAAAGPAGVVLRRSLARSRTVRAAARRHRLALAEIAPTASLAHVLGLVRGLLDRATVAGEPGGVEDTSFQDLFTLADAVAAVVEAPVTIEDAASRVLAYSSRQDVTDPARIDTIVGRRVPPALVAHFRSQGLFRRLARSDEPFLVPPGPSQELPRLVVPVRAGGEWLGSIWVVTSRMPTARVQRELRQVAAVLAIRLLRLRAETDLTRRVTADRLREVLQGDDPRAEWLPPGPWRVVALSRPADSHDVASDLDVWETVFRRQRWQRPLLTDDGGTAWAVVTDEDGAPGSWGWLREVVATETAADPTLRVRASEPVRRPADLPRARAEAAELAALDLPAAVAAVEGSWVDLVLARASAAVGERRPAALETLTAHDEREGTAYLATLAAHLDHPAEAARAAAALHVHPNTLRYRLARITELVGDLGTDDPRTRLALRLLLEAATSS